jgi:hypothetical protein
MANRQINESTNQRINESTNRRIGESANRRINKSVQMQSGQRCFLPSWNPSETCFRRHFVSHKSSLEEGITPLSRMIKRAEIN